jgi:hypothetical protein
MVELKEEEEGGEEEEQHDAAGGDVHAPTSTDAAVRLSLSADTTTDVDEWAPGLSCSKFLISIASLQSGGPPARASAPRAESPPPPPPPPPPRARPGPRRETGGLRVSYFFSHGSAAN